MRNNFNWKLKANSTLQCVSVTWPTILYNSFCFRLISAAYCLTRTKLFPSLHVETWEETQFQFCCMTFHYLSVQASPFYFSLECGDSLLWHFFQSFSINHFQETWTKWCIQNMFILYSTHVAWRIKELKHYR